MGGQKKSTEEKVQKQKQKKASGSGYANGKAAEKKRKHMRKETDRLNKQAAGKKLQQEKDKATELKQKQQRVQGKVASLTAKNKAKEMTIKKSKTDEKAA